MRFQSQFRHKKLTEALEMPETVSGLVLGFFSKGDEKFAVLYEPKILLSKIKMITQHNQEKLVNAIETSIKGMIQFAPPVTGECWGAWEILKSAAEPGAKLGRLLYMVVAGAVPSHKIMSDRRSVSPAARSVWKRLKTQGVETLQFDDESDPKTEPTNDDCMLVKDPEAEFLDYAYQIKDAPNANKLRDLDESHNKFMSELLDELGWTEDVNIDSAFVRASVNYFQTKI